MYLVFEDGTVFAGQQLGAAKEATGEVVFNTSMTGYQEMLTDPSYGGQILVPTYPLIGNYGVNDEDVESRRIQVSAFVVREDCDEPSHPLSTMTIHDYLLRNGVPGIFGVDTRAITRKLRTRGVMMGIVTPREDVQAVLRALAAAPRYGEVDVVHAVSTRRAYDWNLATAVPSPSQGEGRGEGSRRPHIVITDYGVKLNIIRCLAKRGCDVTVVPDTATAAEILGRKPDGVVMSPGPGDPELLEGAVETARGLFGKAPVFGICLGHQVIARAFGASTFKLKFGHRGGNQPVKDLTTGLVYVTAQNHGYAVDAAGLPPDVQVSHMNLNDNTVEGLRHKTLPVLTIQYHSEASPGPHDSEYLFDRFLELVKSQVYVSVRGAGH